MEISGKVSGWRIGPTTGNAAAIGPISSANLPFLAILIGRFGSESNESSVGAIASVLGGAGQEEVPAGIFFERSHTITT